MSIKKYASEAWVEEKLQAIDSGGITSWNDLEDRPFYEVPSKTNIHAENLVVPFVEQRNFKGTPAYYYDLTVIIENYWKYHYLSKFDFVINGVEYKGLIEQYNELGNIYNHGFGDYLLTQYPFFIVIDPDDGLVGLYMTEQFESVTISVTEHTAELIYKLDEKYIPESIARVSDIPEVPTKISDLENDISFTTKEYVDTTIENKADKITSEEAVALLAEVGIVNAIIDENGNILVNENGDYVVL